MWKEGPEAEHHEDRKGSVHRKELRRNRLGGTGLFEILGVAVFIIIGGQQLLNLIVSAFYELVP